MRCSPEVASHSTSHCTHVLPLAGSPSRASIHSPSSTCTSTRVIPPGGAQATPAIGWRPASIVAPLRGTSIRDAVLIGPSFDQPRGHPVAVEVLPRRQLDAVEPLRRRHVAVEAGDDQPGGEAVLGRQRLAVHRHGDERRATVEADLRREAGGEAVDGAADDLRRAGLHPCPVEQRRQPHALPRGVADEVAADLVGHARQRDELLDVGHGDELVVAERVGLVDHALDEQRPRPDVDLRDAERGVDAVEVVVRRDVRRQAGDVEAGRADAPEVPDVAAAAARSRRAPTRRRRSCAGGARAPRRPPRSRPASRHRRGTSGGPSPLDRRSAARGAGARTASPRPPPRRARRRRHRSTARPAGRRGTTAGRRRRSRRSRRRLPTAGASTPRRPTRRGRSTRRRCRRRGRPCRSSRTARRRGPSARRRSGR